MSEWQPIETAPKDGTEYLVADHSGYVWVENHPPGCAPGRWNLISGSWRGAGYRVGAYRKCWMPLPAPPES